MKTILYATDYSQNSVSALLLAHNLAKKLGSKLIVMHVFEAPVTLASKVSISYVKKETKRFVEHRIKLENFCSEHLGDNWRKDNISIVVHGNGSVRDSILEKAVEYTVDMVVVGSRGASALKELILGSTAKGLMRKAPCAVLAVPETFTSQVLKNIVYASDFEQADIFSISKLVKIAEAFDAKIKLIHITTTKEYSGDQQMQWFEEMLGQKVHYGKLEFNLIYADDILAELITFLKDSKADFLAMLERENKGLHRKLFHSDLVTSMESKITVPLMSFNVGGL